MSITKGITVVILLCAIDRATKIAALAFTPSAIIVNAKALFFFESSYFSLGILAVCIVAIGVWFFSEHSFAAAYVFAGALSNVYDRARFGAIIDWIVFPGISVFNLADVFIVLGCVMVAASFFMRKRVY